MQLHGLDPLTELRGLVERIILFDLSDFIHARIADGIGAGLGLQHGPVFGKQNVAVGRPPERAPEIDADFRHLLLEVPPFAVEKILVVVFGIDRQRIDVDEIGLVDRIGPAEMAVVAMQHEGRAGKEPARDMPAFLASQNSLPPGDRTGEGLVRIDEKACGTVG